MRKKLKSYKVKITVKMQHYLSINKCQLLPRMNVSKVMTSLLDFPSTSQYIISSNGVVDAMMSGVSVKRTTG